MQIVSSQEMARIEKIAIDEKKSNALAFMEMAAFNIFKSLDSFVKTNNLPPKVLIFAGKGNNGADAFATGGHLLKAGYDVTVYHLFSIDQCSLLCKYQRQKFKGNIKQVSQTKDITIFSDAIILDGILGTGFNNRLSGLLLETIQLINTFSNIKFAIDIPSGLNGSTGAASPTAMQADYTFFLHLPKLGLFLNDGPNYVGELIEIEFGLKKKYVNLAKNKLCLMKKEYFKKLLPKIDRKRHKYEAGYVTAISGSESMEGAAKLAGLAALRSGCGIVKIFSHCKIDFLPYEIININWAEKTLKEVIETINSSDVCFIGPGIGREKKTFQFLTSLFTKLKTKCVIDGDGLFFVAKNPLIKLPKNTVLTPHKKEMLRLLNLKKDIKDDRLLLKKAQAYSKKKKTVIVLKGFPTYIIHPTKKPLVFPYGDPGMATAGSGDVLTGIISSFVAQGLDIYSAAQLGVYVHDLAGELAAKEKTSYSMIASDIIERLPSAFRSLQ